MFAILKARPEPGLSDAQVEAPSAPGPGEVEITRTTTKVLVQILLLTGLLTVVSAFNSFGISPGWAWGGGLFLIGWLATEIVLLTPSRLMRAIWSGSSSVISAGMARHMDSGFLPLASAGP